MFKMWKMVLTEVKIFANIPDFGAKIITQIFWSKSYNFFSRSLLAFLSTLGQQLVAGRTASSMDLLQSPLSIQNGKYMKILLLSLWWTFLQNNEYMKINNIKDNHVYFCYYLPIICLHHCNHPEFTILLCSHYICICVIFIGHTIFHFIHAP